MQHQPCSHTPARIVAPALSQGHGSRVPLASAFPAEVKAGGVVTSDDTHHLVLIPLDDTTHRITLRRGDRWQRLSVRGVDIILLPAGSQSKVAWANRMVGALVQLDPAVMRDFVQTRIRVHVDTRQAKTARIVEDADLSSLAKRMLDMASTQGIGQDAALNAMADLFVVTLIRNHAEIASSTRRADHLSLPQFHALCAYVDARLDQSVRVDELAIEAGLSPSSLQRKLAADTGLTPSQFLADRRLRRATDLVASTTKSMGEIAYECGFSDQAHLTRTFRKRHGLTPSQYRKNARN